MFRFSLHYQNYCFDGRIGFSIDIVLSIFPNQNSIEPLNGISSMIQCDLALELKIVSSKVLLLDEALAYLGRDGVPAALAISLNHKSQLNNQLE